MLRRIVGVVLLVGLFAATRVRPVWGQHPDTATVLAPAGARIRVRLNSGVVETGRLPQPLTAAVPTLVYCPAATLACPGGDSTRLRQRAWPEVAELERRTGERTVRGALIGGAIGAGVLLVGSALWHDEDAPPRQGPSRVVALVSFTSASVLVGALIGSGQGEWEHVR
jgi:hypothetical protein